MNVKPTTVRRCVFLITSKRKRNLDSRKALKKVYETLTAAGVRKLHYLAGEHLLGDDGEATVDSPHPTDLGFVRQAGAFEKVLRPILKSNGNAGKSEANQ